MKRTHIHDSEAVNGTMMACQEAIGYLFRREGLLRKALTHSSVKDALHPSNERLEFLGDAILGMVISEYLFATLPDRDEGELTKVKSVVVSGDSLSRLGLEMGLDRYLLIGKGLRLKREIPRSLIANMVEAIIAAVYLDRGMEAARHFVLDHLHSYVEEVMNDDHEEKNYKSLLQQSAQKLIGQTPTYRVLGERGPDHSKLFRVAAQVGGTEYPFGKGACKKDAEQDAARIALGKLRKSGGPSRRTKASSRKSSGRRSSKPDASSTPARRAQPKSKAARPARKAAARPAKKTPDRGKEKAVARAEKETPPRRRKKSAPRPAKKSASRPAKKSAPRPAKKSAARPAKKSAARPVKKEAPAKKESPPPTKPSEGTKRKRRGRRRKPKAKSVSRS